MTGLSDTDYIEWGPSSEQFVCDFGDYRICRDSLKVEVKTNQRRRT